MAKNIVVCSDGTGNTANKNRGTNVFKIYEAVDLHSHIGNEDRKPQVAIYDDGVGTQSFKPLKIIGGAFGWGLKDNVKQLYRELARVYEPRDDSKGRPGDDIYVFGFSRGAFTVRTLVGLISYCGLPKYGAYDNEKELQDLVDKAYSSYRKRFKSLLGSLFHWPDPIDESKFHPDIPIKFMGVWDTVAAVGTPFAGLTWFWNTCIHRFTFQDNELYSKVEKACHALALDDQRTTFHPNLWNESDEKTDRIEQVWFSGMHSNVGGGYPKQGMSLVSLHWMMNKAHDQGLHFIKQDRALYRERRNVHDKLYNSRAGLAVYYRYQPREFDKICEKLKVKLNGYKVHISVLNRIAQGEDGYAPGNLPREFKAVSDQEGWDDGGAFSQLILPHLEANEITLMDRIRSYVCTRRIAYFIFILASLIALGTHLCREFIKGLPFTKVFGNLLSWDTLASLFKIIFCDYYMALGVALGIAFGLSYWARRRIENTCTGFWHPLAKKLSDRIDRCGYGTQPMP